MNKILVVVGGGVRHINPFVEAGKELGLDVTVASLAKLEYATVGEKVVVKISGSDLKEFNVIYLRLVGKRYEDAALLVNYARENGLRIVDEVYERDGLIRVPIPKSIETKMLYDAHLPVPKSYFGRMKMIAEAAPELFGFPFVIKGTTGKQGHAVWSPQNIEELNKLVEEFTPLERTAKMRFVAQEFIEASQRNRIFIIGDRAIAGITRPTRWRKRFLEKVNGEFPEGTKTALDPIPAEDADIALSASRALGINIGGADIITEDKTGKKYVLEVNSAPRWVALKRDTGINVEKEIVKYLASID
jgi:glutathione synthase/RimK-type ligase-like ATP-grasp enzyme